MGQNGSFKILGKSSKTETCSDGVDLTSITFTSDYAAETKANNSYNSTTQKHWSPLENSKKYRSIGERPTSPSPHNGQNERATANKKYYEKKIASLESEVQNDRETANKEYYEKKIASLEFEVQQLREAKENLMAGITEPFDESQKLSKDYQERMQMLEIEVQHLKDEKNKLFTRLCEVGAVHLTDSNPNIADLSDTNRPDKLTEQMSELYDNEWTGAYEYLTEIEGLQDEETVRLLLNILHTMYAICLESTTKQAEDLKNAMCSYLGLPDERKDDLIIKDVLTRLRESKATEFEATIERIMKDARRQLTDLPEGKDCGVLDTYIQKCTYICWFMCIKDPHMHLDFGGIQRNRPPSDDATDVPLYFDTTKFSSYTRAGMHVEYVVWPAVYLYKNGPIVKRGIAQGINIQPEVRESTVEMKGVNSNDTSDTIHADADHEYNGDSPNDDVTIQDDEDEGIHNDPHCSVDSAHETVKEDAHNLNFSSFTEHDDVVDTDQEYNVDAYYSDSPENNDEEGDISDNHHSTNDMAQEKDEEHAQNLISPDLRENDNLSVSEYSDVSIENIRLTSSEEDDGYARLSDGTNVSKKDENNQCQDEFDTDEPIFGNFINIDKNAFAVFKEPATELKPKGSRTGLYEKNKKKK
ncbi:hypothetical protein ACJMK2_031853 [Sinanodonta woodiana]|uniref:Mitochondria-eating protein n=1 Tax=Sinanodonta woodiana TaxID=1069815 RepID=A0ABD3WZZ9_SINWO